MRPLGGAVLFVLVLAGGGANAADLTLTDTHLQFHLQGAEARSPVAWGALFLRRADRFMVGADTWVPSRWASLAAVETETRAWLGQSSHAMRPSGSRRTTPSASPRVARRKPRT